MIVRCCVTPAHEVLLKDYFQPSLPLGWELQVHTIDLAGPGNFLDASFLACIRHKLDLILESLQGDDNTLVVWSDVDIVFFEREGAALKGVWEEQMENKGLDILFQRECGHLPDVNTGFFVARKSAEVRSFFERVIQVLKAEPSWNEQKAANELLSGSLSGSLPLRWGYLDQGYYARTQGWPPPRSCVMYHANATAEGDALAQKKIQLSRAKLYVQGGPWQRLCITALVFKERGLDGLWQALRRRMGWNVEGAAKGLE